MDIAARSAETVNASHTAGRMSRPPRQRQRYFVSFAARDIGERQLIACRPNVPNEPRRGAQEHSRPRAASQTSQMTVTVH